VAVPLPAQHRVLFERKIAPPVQPTVRLFNCKGHSSPGAVFESDVLSIINRYFVWRGCGEELRGSPLPSCLMIIFPGSRRLNCSKDNSERVEDLSFFAILSWCNVYPQNFCSFLHRGFSFLVSFWKPRRKSALPHMPYLKVLIISMSAAIG
jgi:hypothetical protein